MTNERDRGKRGRKKKEGGVGWGVRVKGIEEGGGKDHKKKSGEGGE